MKRKKVYVCAPFGGSAEAIERNTLLTKHRCRALYESGLEPIAPQLYYSQFLDDLNTDERKDGLSAALEWLKQCDVVYVYADSPTVGMAAEIEYAKKHGIPIQRMSDEKKPPAM